MADTTAAAPKPIEVGRRRASALAPTTGVRGRVRVDRCAASRYHYILQGRAMGWYRVVKTIKGHRYVYEQRTWREGKRVRTENRYIGPEGGGGRAAGGSSVTTTTPLPIFSGQAWRADTGLLIKGKTALEVVELEEQELGNTDDFKHLSAELRATLATIPASEIVWVTKRKKDADRYGEAERVDLGEAPLVLAEDGDGGYLILKKGLVTTTPRLPAVPPRLIEQTFRELTKRADIPLPPPIFAEGRQGKILVRKDREIESLIKALNPKFRHDERGAYYDQDIDEVNIPPLRMYDNHEDDTATQKYYSIVFHELAHWTGRADRTGRHQRGDPFSGAKGYAREELVAEATATLLMRHFDLQSEAIDRHIMYFQSYLEAAGDREEALAFAMEEARRAADFILGVAPMLLPMVEPSLHYMATS